MKTLTLREMTNQATLFKETRYDVVVPISSARFASDNTLITMAQPMAPTEHAFSQLLKRITGTTKPKDFLWNMVAKNYGGLAPTLNPFFSNPKYNLNKKGGTKDLLLRSRLGTLRAVFSPEYVIYDTHDILSDLNQLIESWELHQPAVINGSWLDSDGMYIKMVWRNLSEGKFGLGVAIKTSEIGKSRIHIMPHFMKTSCINSYTLSYNRDEQKELDIQLGIQHRWKTHDEMSYHITKALAFCLDKMDEFSEKYVQAAKRDLLSPEHVLAQAIKAKLGRTSEEVILTGVKGMEGGNTVAAVADGITYAAQHDSVSSENRAELEALGGGLIHLSSKTDNDDNLIRSFFALTGKPIVTEEES